MRNLHNLCINNRQQSGFNWWWKIITAHDWPWYWYIKNQIIWSKKNWYRLFLIRLENKLKLIFILGGLNLEAKSKNLESIKRYGKHFGISQFYHPLIIGFMNKNIVKYGNTLKVFIDSYSFEKLLSEGNKDAEKILNCYTNNYFDFTRSTFRFKK